MLDLLGHETLAQEETLVLEPSCGDGQMLEVIVERLYTALLPKCEGNKERALAEACYKFYAIEIDPAMVEACRRRIYDAFCREAETCNFEALCSYLLMNLVNRQIACQDFFEFIKRMPPSEPAEGYQRELFT